MDTEKILKKLTKEQKVKLVCGKDAWHTCTFDGVLDDQIEMNDGPHGLRHETFENGKKTGTVKATAFAASSLLACSFSKELAGEIGKALGEETQAAGVNMLLGPGVNIKRNPLCGRNFEYMSEDPVLAGKLGAEWIKGLESTGTGASLKHFACNNKEILRTTYNVMVDERTLREIYLKPFEICVKEGKPSTIMTSYNKTNGYYTGENYHICEDILRKEWGYSGLLVSDWDACKNRVLGLKAGQDLQMPNDKGKNEKVLLDALSSGELKEEELDRCAERILNLIDKLKKSEKKKPFDEDKHQEILEREALESIVLLKNNGVLPLKKDAKILVVGEYASNHRYGGGGSSDVNAISCVSFTEGLTKAGISFDYLPGLDTKCRIDKKGLKKAADYETVIYFAGMGKGIESEGYDRSDLRFSEDQYLIFDELYKYNKNIVTVLVCGAPVDIPFADLSEAVLYLGYSGGKGGDALTKIIYGDVNPSGKLAETYPLSYSDCVSSESFTRERTELHYAEAGYVGYRYYKKAGINVRYCFGHGLSYTTFEYSGLKVNQGEQGVEVSFTVKNTGKVKGKEAAQIYIRKPQSSVPNPLYELKDFVKPELAPGESKVLSVIIPFDEFKVYDLKTRKFVLEAGEYGIFAGSSSDDIRLEEKIKLEGTAIKKPDIPDCYFKLDRKPSAEDYLAVLKYDGVKEYSGNEIHHVGTFDGTDSLNCLSENGAPGGKLITKLMKFGVKKFVGGKNKYVAEALSKNTGDIELSLTGLAMGKYFVEGILLMANGHFFKGLSVIGKKDKDDAVGAALAKEFLN